MKQLRLLAWLGAFIGLAAPLSAQNFKFVSGNPYGTVTGFGFMVGPYRGQLIGEPGSPMIDIFCVDFLGRVQNGQSWTADFTNLGGNLGDTRMVTELGLSQGDALGRYQMAAWLSTQFQLDNKSQWSAIHGTIWNLMEGRNVVALSSSTQAYWLGLAAQNLGDINLGEWTIISDPNGSKQEFLTRDVVPEPATVILLGSALLMLGFVAYRRSGAA
jgi:hypothetical protein